MRAEPLHVSSIAGDTSMLLTIGVYLLAAAALGVMAFPRSPMWALFPSAVVFISS